MKKSINICFILAIFFLFVILFSACNIEEDTPVVASPVFSSEAVIFKGSTNVVITCGEPGATIRYTTNGRTPTGYYGTIYTQPIVVSSSVVIKARAVKPRCEPSRVVSARYTITDTTAAPTFSLSGGTYHTNLNIRIECATRGASIRYTTDGTIPTPSYGKLVESSTIYIPTHEIYSVTNCKTIKAIAFYSNWADSQIAAAEYTLQANPPRVSPVSGNYVPGIIMQINNATWGSSDSWYSFDGGQNWNRKVGGFIFREITNSCRIIVKSIKVGWADSVATTYTYNIDGSVAVPDFSLAAGTYAHPTNVQISCTTPGVTIEWTTNGGYFWLPGTSVDIPEDRIVTVRASKNGLVTTTATAIYKITGP